MVDQCKRRLKNGVPQGSVLVPLLFSIYISVLPTTVSRKYAYADDLANMHADEDWQAVEGVLRWARTWLTVDENLQTWKLKLSTTKMVSTAFQLNNKEAKREMKSHLQQRTPALLRAQISPSNVGQVAHVSPTPWGTLQEADITRRAPEVTCWLRLRCFSNNSANSHASLGAFNRRVLRACLVPQCSYPPYRPRHQRRLANCDWMLASYTSGKPSHSRRHPTCWASSQWKHTVSSTPCHGAWTLAPLSAHLSIECRCTASHIETPICTHRTTTHQFIWQQQQHTCGALRGVISLDGTRGKKQVWRPHVRIEVFRKQTYYTEKSTAHGSHLALLAVTRRPHSDLAPGKLCPPRYAPGRITNGIRGGRKTPKTLHFHSRHRYLPHRNDPPKKSQEPGSGSTAPAPVSGVSAHICTNGVWPPLRPMSVAQKNKPSTMLSSNVQSIDLLMDCTAWRFWTMRKSNGCSTPAPKSRAAKQWLEELAQKRKCKQGEMLCHIDLVMGTMAVI